MSIPENNNSATLPSGGEAETNVNYEKRFKDTQSAYTKSQQELKAAKAKLEALEKLTQPVVQLDEATQAQLDELKYANPEAWRDKMNSLEAEAKLKYLSALSEAEKIAMQQDELEQRAQILSEYNSKHPHNPITDEVIMFDVPPRITKKLENGEISFEQFLSEAHNFLYTPKTVGDTNKPLNQPNMKNFGGGVTPSEDAQNSNVIENYKNLVY